MNAILFMRAGSTRIINKNTKLMNGKPLFHYILNTLSKSKFVENIAINTDIEEVIQECANKEKIIIIKRKEHLKNIRDGNWIIKDTIDQIPGDLFIQVHATNPLLKTETIDEAIKKFLNSDNDCLFSVSKLKKRFWDHHNQPINHDPQNLLPTQDLDPLFEENSCFYMFSRKSFNRNNNRVGENPMFYETPLMESLDIDYEEDFRLIETILKTFP
jgi:CMP-N-acetylneuraminic acid synthetase